MMHVLKRIMIRTSPLKVFLWSTFFLGSFLHGLDYDFKEPPSVIDDHREYRFTLTSRDRIQIKSLPEHHKIFWLSTITTREEGPIDFDAYILTVRFMATSPGIIQFPPIPTKIGDEEFLLRVNDITARPNSVPEKSCKIELLWDGEPETPQELYIGQTVELTIKETIINQRNAIPTHPARRLNGVDWHVYTPKKGRRARDRDYLRPYGRSWFGSSRHPFKRYRLEKITEEETPYSQYNYQTRFTVGATNRLTGHCYFNAEIGMGERVAMIAVDIPVKSVPPLPHETAIDTGLVGQWEIQGEITPASLEVNRPFLIALGMVGQGNPTLLRDFDFARPGFSSIQLNTEHLNKENRYEKTQEISFQQELLPSGDAPIFPPITLASFNPHLGKWELHHIAESITLQGLSEAVSATTQLVPTSSFGKELQRPIFLNLPVLTFPLIALAPFLPLLAGLLKRRLDQRDPEQDARKAKFSALLDDLQKEDASEDLIDTQVLPTLRDQLNLPPGASSHEIAQALKDSHPELAELIIQQRDAAFTSSDTHQKIDLKTLAHHLAKISLLILCFTAPLQGSSLTEANAAFQEKRYRTAAENYEQLIAEHPGHPHLHLNLAKARLSADQAAHARAACHTALLLDPLNSDGRQLMDQILQRMGQPTLPGTQLLALRPDQFLFLAAWLWLVAFLILAINRLKKIPQWPAWICFFFAITFSITAFWRKQQAYAANQYMVLAEELPREPQAGTPNWNFPALRSGQIIKADHHSETHAHIITPDTSFWLPLDQLQQVW